MLRKRTKSLRSAAKVVVAGTVVAGLFGTIVTFYPSIERGEFSAVKESQADIFALSFGAPTNTEKFGSALERLGHEPPRVYRANENAVFFSTALVKNKRPNEVLRDYQEEFVRQGLNTRVYLTPVPRLNSQGAEETHEVEAAAMNGEIIPYLVDANTMSMGGSVMDLSKVEGDGPGFAASVARLEKNVGMFGRAYEACGGSQEILEAKRAHPELSNVTTRVEKAAAQVTECTGGVGGTCSEARANYKVAAEEMSALKAAVESQPELRRCEMMKNASRANVEESKDDFSQKLKAFRSIEATYDAKSNATHVSATWSDENFDATKFRTKSMGELDETKVSESLPLCDGCRRTWDFGGSGSESPYSTTQINSPNSVSLVSDYYVKSLEREGWKVTDSQKATDELMRLSNDLPDSRWIRIARGNEHMTVQVSTDPRGGSRIVATTAN